MRVTLREGLELHVHAAGEGPPDVLLLHGWVVSGEVWRPVIDRWPASGAGRLLAVDLRGAGWSSKPRSGYRPEDHAADMSALIDQLGLERVVLVGHSMGGQVAQRVALDRPDAVARLVLVCPVPAGGVPMDEAQAGFLHSLHGSYEGIRQVISMLLVAPVEEARLERLVLAASATASAAFHEALDAWRHARFHEALTSLRVPTAVIAGDSDHALPADFVRAEVKERIAGATFTILPGCGHYPQLEATEQLSRIIAEQAAAV